MLTGSDLLLKSLQQENVTNIFGYPGGAVIPFYDKLPNYDINHILVRHEQAAALAADGYARVTGKAGVCLATSGPGGTNLVTGIANAYMDSIPVIALTGQVPLPVIGTDAFQEIDITGITQPITKHNYLVEKAKDIPRIIKEAFHIATTGRPGPVHIDFPKDILSGTVEKFDYPKKINLPGYKIETAPITTPQLAEQIQKVAQALKKAHQPVLLAGHGITIANATKELKEFAEKIQIPVAPTLLGLGTLPYDHYLNLGMIGMHGFAHANYALHHADLILNIGSRFDDRIIGNIEEFGKNATIIHIDIDPSELNKTINTDIAICADAKQALLQLIKQAKPGNYTAWWKQIDDWKQRHPFNIYENEKFTTPKAIHSIFEQTQGKYNIVTDVGQHQMWTAQVYGIKNPNKWLSSGGLGDMGYGVPAAMGAFTADPANPTWCISGDGSFQMNLQELQTIAHEEMNIKIAIMNNGYLGMVRQWQELFYNKNYSGVDITAPDFVKLANAYNIKGYRVTNEKEAQKTIKEVMEIKGPALIDFVVDREHNVMPMVPAGKSLGEVIVK